MAAHFGRRLRRGATATAVAAAAIAALSASGAPNFVTSTAGGGGQAADDSPPPGTTASGDCEYHTDLPPLVTPAKPADPVGQQAQDQAAEGIPASVLAAYKRAESDLARTDPGCNLPWQLLAAIGKVESGQASGGRVDSEGTTLQPILGPVLNGNGFANIPDTDNGAYDDDKVHDRAVGPLQFIPLTWERWGQDGNGDGSKDPNNIYDAALAAGHYLCANGRDLSVEADLHEAILSYNHSQDYLNLVLQWFEYYGKGVYEVPDGTGQLPTSTGPGSTGPDLAGNTPRTQGPSTPPPATPPHDADPGSPKPPHETTPPPSSSPSAPPSTPPSTPPITPPGQPKPPVVKPPVLQRIVNAGKSALSSVAGSLFDDRAAVYAEDSAGKPMGGVAVTFTIVGTTDTRFDGGAESVTVTTGKDGLATAPALRAGASAGSFVVRASVSGRGSVGGVEFATTVTPRLADELTSAAGSELTAALGAAFDSVSVKATSQGSALAGAELTASITSADGTELTAGPSFKADAGSVRSLDGLKTNADGLLELPEINAGDTAGTFVLRVTAAGGATLAIQLKVA